MRALENPFVIKGRIPDAYFCDREQETEQLVRWVTNGNNVVLIAPRRIGKTQLIDHCFVQPAIKDQYLTIFVDILQTTNLQEFTYELGKAVFEAAGTVESKLMKLFMQTVRSLHGEFGFDPFTNLPKFTLSIGHIENPVYTIEEIFRFLEASEQRCIVAIDEFQRIAQFPEKNVEAILRTHIQHMRNCNFIFAGSEQHLLSQIFLDYNRPFYASATMMNLEKIELSKYADFAMTHFDEYGKQLSAETVNRVYELVNGNTFALQKIMNVAFSLTPENEACEIDTIRRAIDEIVSSNDYDYRTRLMTMSVPQKEVLYAVGRKGVVTQITGSEFVSKFRLGSASSVQSALRKLRADGWLAESFDAEGNKQYQLSDIFLTLWIQTKYGTGYKL
jgi:AAA+ ATPase superfamily predicted ATPase